MKISESETTSGPLFISKIGPIKKTSNKFSESFTKKHRKKICFGVINYDQTQACHGLGSCLNTVNHSGNREGSKTGPFHKRWTDYVPTVFHRVKLQLQGYLALMLQLPYQFRGTLPLCTSSTTSTLTWTDRRERDSGGLPDGKLLLPKLTWNLKITTFFKGISSKPPILGFQPLVFGE